MQEVYLIISNNEKRSKVHGVCTKEAAVEHYNLMCSYKPVSWIREEVKPFITDFYSLEDDGNKKFQERIYLEKKFVVGS